MGVIYIAKRRVVKVSIGPATGNRIARFVNEGEIIPEGVDQDSLDNLLERGLIEAVESEEENAGGESGNGYPDGDPAEEWTIPELKRYAKANDVTLPKGAAKPQILEALAAAAVEAAAKAAAGANGSE